jgi:hypothetical protein
MYYTTTMHVLYEINNNLRACVFYANKNFIPIVDLSINSILDFSLYTLHPFSNFYPVMAACKNY